ncbi:MAG: barstar family protein [Gemmatimonadaceae bacterium]
MTATFENFEFFRSPPSEESLAKATVARVAFAAGGKRELLDALAKQLFFPDYFGYNWDALEESMQDLLPNQGRLIAVIHEVIPSDLSDDDLRAYLNVLRRVMAHRVQVHEPPLRVFFAEHCRGRLQRLARQDQ